jgi:DNA-binding NarL/FixJ family response regulator
LLDALVEMFWLLWDQAVPVVTAGMDPLEARLMTLLAAGLKDDAIARQLTLSSRTVGRRVAELMDTLGARTRFQAGVHAQRRRLLEDT